jgi:hypothetical protein
VETWFGRFISFYRVGFIFNIAIFAAALYSDNSNSSQNLSNPTTNITNGLGIFTGISSDTLYLQVKQK